ncbi:hypothetical protein ACIRPX_38755 [Streptomyces sp. NPDC101225]|uniref:hypothetical protein n=1 Tax=Streptomyces sp. NPDC101225 TaxID=3366135 RepID=UPI00380992E5
MNRARLGSAGLLVASLILSATGCGDGGRQPVETKAEPATTVTATVTATPEPGPTVTETVTARPKPRPTVTVTRTVTVKAAGTSTGSGGSGSSSGGGGGTGTCSIVSNAGNCYAAGQFCRSSDHGAVTTTAGGSAIKCTYSANAWRWTYA